MVDIWGLIGLIVVGWGGMGYGVGGCYGLLWGKVFLLCRIGKEFLRGTSMSVEYRDE